MCALEMKTLCGKALVATVRHSRDVSRGGVEVVVKDLRGAEAAVVHASQLNAIGRFWTLPDPGRPGRSVELGPIDVARLKAFPTADRSTQVEEGRRLAG